MNDFEVTEAQCARFERDGFVIVDRIISDEEVAVLRERYDELFKGRWETGLVPDEVNWLEGRDAPDRTRQICNAWKSDRYVAAVILQPSIGRACARLGGCATGEAVMTPGFGLEARYIIHTVGPVWRGGTAGEDDLLASCYRRSLALANEAGLASIAFPAISTGIFGFPAARAAPLAVRTVRAAVAAGGSLEEVIFCCYSTADLALYETALASFD